MKEYLDLPLEDGTKFCYQPKRLQSKINELDEFICDCSYMDNLVFAKKMLFSHELQANNQVEGYGDDLAFIEQVIQKKTKHIKSQDKRKRVLNLYRGYQYILKNKIVDENHLSELYKILSSGLLEDSDLSRMGALYRGDTVYILNQGRLDYDLYEGVHYTNISELMDKYFKFYHTSFGDNTKTDEYIKSQILHFYFVYVHPYFDVNGRTSRTMSMWHLLNKEAYPYIIFNRGIRFQGSRYDKMILETSSHRDLTFFLQYMLDTLKVELEKEYVMRVISSNVDCKLSGVDYQTLLYLLTLNGVKTAKDFAQFYNRFNDKKSAKEIYEEMLLPLIDMEILNVIRYSKKHIFNDVPNIIFDFNSNKLDGDMNKIKKLELPFNR